MNATDPCSGRYFDDTSIPFPTITRHDDSISISKPNKPTEHSPDQLQIPSDADAVVQATSPSTAPDPSPSDDSMKLRSGLKSSSDLSAIENGVSQTSASGSKASQLDSQDVVPDDVAPPELEEEAQLSGATQQLLDYQHPARPTKVVHIPEEASPATDRAEATDRTLPSKSSVNQLQTHTEPASSPSSTVGPYSAATPLPPQDSPDTSPDSESADQPEEALTPKDLRPSPEAQREKEEHDRLLEAQKEIARKQALGDVSDPNDQLLWEEREAAARAAEEQRARMSVGGPEAAAQAVAEQTTAADIADDMVLDKEVESIVKTEAKQKKVATKEEIPNSSQEMDDDDDNITVTQRSRAPLTIDTSQLQTSTAEQPLETPAEDTAITTQPTSSQSKKRTASDAFAPSRLPREEAPPSAVSPTAMRHPQDTAGPSVSFQTPRKTSQPLAGRSPQIPNNAQAVLDQLSSLKGVANDPDRDYLESLFRIQVLDSLNPRSTPLPELVRSASKSLSTQDHFTSAHERLDYKELRKIYQLQNANKWSLRQMEKAKEPQQPVTHHDHLMAEMKWMRKDFKAERKMKQSVCAWLAARCAEWVAADAAGRKSMQVQVRAPREKPVEDEEQPPELEHSGESAAEDEPSPPTPKAASALPARVIVPPGLSDTVSDLRKTGKLDVALKSLPVAGWQSSQLPYRAPLDPMSKFVKGTVFPVARKPKRKRGRFDYEDDDELLDSERSGKRMREDRALPPEDQDIALFHPENKPIRDRLHANNTFRPPSEFVMPSTQFYEFRNGSQWVWEDDQKLRKLAKEYSFNWSLISDELTLPASFKSSAERRTPWECFERWVELEQLPSEMRKTMYFKTWFQRLEQSQQAAERRYQAQVAALQAANGQQAHIPTRRRTTPTRVDKRKNTRYLWLVDAMRKLARKKEAQAYKQAEGEYSKADGIADKRENKADMKHAAQRAAAQRKTQAPDPNHQRAPAKTPKEFSRMRQELDNQQAERLRQHRQKQLEAHQKQLAQRQQQQQQGLQGAQQRPGSSSNAPTQQTQMQANGQPQQPNMNGQQGRPQLPVATRNGHLAVPQMNAQGIPQAQMRPNGPMQNPHDMQRIAHANAQARNAQYGNQQQQYAQMQPSPGNGGMSNQQQMQSNQALLAAMQQQGGQQAYQQANNPQTSGSPSMPPPPTPQGAQKTLSSGHVPAIVNIQANLRQRYPNHSEEQITSMATELLRSQSQQSNAAARQNAMNAAAGINGSSTPQQQGNMQQAYAQNQAAFQSNQQMQNGNVGFANGDGFSQQQSPQQQQHYAAQMRQRQMQQMRLQQSPGSAHATLNGSPSMANASPAPISPNMQFSNVNGGTPQMAAAQMNMGGMNQQRPPSRSATPQMQRLGSSGSVPGLQQGMPSPNQVNGMQGSPRNMQANMARS